MVSLPSFRPPSSRVKELLEIILSQARAALKADLSSEGDRSSLKNSRAYLDLALFIAADKRLAPPSQVLRFYYASLAPKLVLGRLSEEDQSYVIEGIARMLVITEDAGSRTPPTAPAADQGRTRWNASDVAEDAALRRQFPDICVALLQVSP